jgi:ABC-type Zn2+ transport system substrate-binding protein/surface adhesin
MGVSLFCGRTVRRPIPNTHTQTHTHRHTQTDTHRHTQTDRHTHTHTQFIIQEDTFLWLSGGA